MGFRGSKTRRVRTDGQSGVFCMQILCFAECVFVLVYAFVDDGIGGKRNMRRSYLGI